MSNLLEQASLVMIPSGYKEDIVYSVIPTSGAGDLSFTRASNGTRINSAGLVEVCPWNTFEYSEQFDNAIWAKDAGNTITANSTTAPNGTATADTLSASAGSVFNVSQLITTTAGVYTYSIYLKKNATNLMSTYIYLIGTGFVASGEVNFDNGTYTTSSGTGAIENIGNGWFRILLTQTLSAGVNSFGIINVSTTGTRSVYAWGAQVNIGSTAKPYFPTTDRLNVPRLTYPVGGGCPSLLLEKQSTNNFSYSEQFDNGFWTTIASSITANNTTSPDGTQNAEKLTEYGNNSIHSFYNTNSIVVAATNTASIFYKKGTRRYFSIKLQVGTNSYTQVYDADGVTTGSSSSNGLTSVSSTIVSMGNGWVRATLTGTDASGGGSGYGIFSLSDSANPTFDAGNFNPTYQGSTSEYGYFWGAQLEASSYPTSYIPTTSSSATRVADDCFKTGISSLIGQTEGVLFVDFVCNGIQDLYGNIINSEKNVTNSFYVHFGLDGVIRAGIFANSVQRELTASGFVVGQRYKLAFAYKSGDLALYSNGVQKTTSPSSFAFNSSLDDIYLNDTTTYFGYQENFNINEAILFPTRLTNSELAQLTGNQNYTINQAYASYGVASESPNCVQP